MPVVVNTSFNT
jgi:carbamoyltransferase